MNSSIDPSEDLDLATGVFLTRDPAGFVDGPNLYTYVRQNPWSKFDPEGLYSWEEFKADYYNFSSNVVYGYAQTQLPESVVGRQPIAGAFASKAGRTIGLGIGLAQGGIELAQGGTMAIGGGAAALLSGGTASPVAVPLTIAGVVEAGHGIYVLSNGLDALNDTRNNQTSNSQVAGDSPEGATAKQTVEGAAETADTAKTTPQGYGPLPPGEAPYQLKLFPDEAFDRTVHYGHSPTATQRRMANPDSFDHDPPLVQHYWEGNGQGGLPGFNLTQTERLQQARSMKGKTATQKAQDAQGAAMSRYSAEKNKQFGGLKKPKK